LPAVAWRILLLGGLALACDSSGVPDGTVAKPVYRFVDLERAGQGLLTAHRPVATVQDETRYVLRAPPRETLFWPEVLEDRSGDRVVTRRQVVPHAFRDAPALLVMPQVVIGASWHQMPPEVRRNPRGAHENLLPLEFPIPPNPERRRLSLTALAYAIGLVDLTRLETRAVEVPDAAELEFGIGLLEPRWGYDPVEFTVLACAGGRCETLFQESFDPSGSEGAGWRDLRVSLAALAGQTRRFRFEAKRLSEEAPFSFPVWANPTIYAQAPRGEEELNVILLSIDTLRADHLGSYGYRHDTAPFVEQRFARGGTLFEQPVAAATITTPSHASIFTALSPALHGTTDGMKVLPKNIPTLAERVRHAGLDTAAFTEDGWLSVSHGFGRGFDAFAENKSPNIMEPDGQVDVTFAQARRWLERNRHKRFFLFLHTFQVHTPYAAPERYADLFTEHASGRIDETSPSQLRWMAEYDREIRYTDDELRRLFATIDDLELGEDTVFILTSDHGEAFLEHGVLEHGSRLDEEAVRVPLMFWGKGIAAGRRIEVPVAHVDLMPTILDLLGIPAPPSVEGLSLVDLIRGGGGGEAFARRPLFSESRGNLALGPERRMQRFFPPAFLVRVGDRKLVRYRTADGGFRYEYYDVAADPLERSDLYPSRAEEVQGLRGLIELYEERDRETRARLDRGARTQPQGVLLDPRQAAKLRALGYLE
jgi:arylsulfatase A-like enzyme